MKTARRIFSYRKFWAHKLGPAPMLPMTVEEMTDLGWDACDIIIVTGDAYVDHPSFGMAVIGRLLEAQGFRIGIISQPDWRGPDDFRRLGKPNLFFGVTAGNMDSMVNHYTSDRRIRSNDAYTPNGEAGKRPYRAAIVELAHRLASGEKIQDITDIRGSGPTRRRPSSPPQWRCPPIPDNPQAP